MAEELPRMFAGRYEVGELIGRGGMAEVHIGRDTRLGRTVAIKALRTDLLADPTFQARFSREAQSAASLNHPSIVSVYDSGEETITAADGSVHRIPFIVMEYVEGHTVRDLVRDGTALPLEEAIEITIGVLNALEYSHHSGIVHRDIKPANVMLTPTGAIKVMDFGIARVLTDPSSTMTQTQAVVGTAQYLSPEQAKGEVVDARSDLYSTGCLLYELLTGRPPFQGDSAVAVAYQHVGEQAPVPSSIAPDVPDALDRITMKALMKDREQRYSSAAEFRSDLEAAARSGIVAAPAVAAPVAATQVMGGQPPFPVPAATTALPANTGAYTSLHNIPQEDEPQKSRAWIWILLVALLVAGGIAIYVLMNKEAPDDGPVQVPVPELAQGMSEQEARRLVESANLVPAIQDPKSDDDVEEGTLLEWDPDSGEMVDEGSQVNLTFSAGPGELTMPDLVDYKRDDAQAILENAKFDLRNVRWESEHVEIVRKDFVTRTTPEAGDKVGRDEKITVYYATGDVDVPDVTNMQLSEARELLPRGISRVENPVETDEYAPGTVLSQDRSGIIPNDSTIVLEFAVPMPPEPEPTETEEPEPTDTESPDPTETETSSPPEDEDGDQDGG